MTSAGVGSGTAAQAPSCTSLSQTKLASCHITALCPYNPDTMSERGQFRGGRGGGRGGDRGGRGGGRGGAQSGGAAGQTERPKKENILDLSKYMDKQLTVKFSGGREGE